MSAKKPISLILTALFIFSGMIILNDWVTDEATGTTLYHRGDISGNETWSGNDVHIVDDEFNISAGNTLIIEAGAMVKVDIGGKITVGSGGKLVINGTPEDRVFITSNATSPAPGDYVGIDVEDGGIAFINYTHLGNATKGIDISGGDTQVNYCVINETSDFGIEYTGVGSPVIDHCKLNNTGGGGVGDGGIRIGSNGIISNCEIFNSSDTGIYVGGGTPTIMNTRIHNTTGYGIRIGSSYNPSVSGCTIMDTGSPNIYVSGTTRTITFDNCTLDNSGLVDTIQISGTDQTKKITVVLLNTTFKNDTFDVPEYGNLTVKWYENTEIENQFSEPIAGATVNLTNQTGSVVDSRTTDADGRANWLEGIEFIYNSTGFVYEKFHSIDVSHPGYDHKSVPVRVEGFNNTVMTLTDSEAPTSTVDPISPYWWKVLPISIDSSAGDMGTGVQNVTLWYRFSTDNKSWDDWLYFGKDAASPWSFDFNAPNGTGHYEFHSIANDATGNLETPPGSNDTKCGYDATAPTSSVDTVDPYWQTGAPIAINVTASDTGTENVENVTLWYRFSADNGTWNGWRYFDTDTASPWSFDFNAPHGSGFYEFYSVSNDSLGNQENSPGGNDTICGYDAISPTANAGADQTLNQNDLAIFDGTASTDNIGIVNYTWTFSDGEEDIELYGDCSMYTFTNASNYTITLTVTDAAGRSSGDDMWILVNDTTAPVADAGVNHIINQGEAVNLNGSGSSDNVGVTGYNWTFEDDGPQEIHGMNVTYIFRNAGTFDITLNVSDAAGNWDEDTVIVEVNDTIHPYAQAGENVIIDQGETVYFNGNHSTDNVDIVSYVWTFEDDGKRILQGISPNHTFERPGNFQITLNVTDARGNWDSDTLTVTVNDTGKPVASAGPDRYVNQHTLVIFDGSNTTDNVNVTLYMWTFVYNGNNKILYGVGQVFLFDTAGVFNVTLNVSDASGNWDVDHKLVTVYDITPPESMAGGNITIDQKEKAVFNGNRSTDNVGIVNYTWSFMYDHIPRRLYGITANYTFHTADYYYVQLIVTDARGNRDSSGLMVMVNDITAPAAKAGQSMLDDMNVTLDASASSDNVGIVNYTWSFIASEQQTVLYGVKANFTFADHGVYKITLTVTDAAGNSGTDHLVIEIEEETQADDENPVAAASFEPASVYEGDTVTFDGSSSGDNIGIVEYIWAFMYEGKVERLYGIKPVFKFDVPGEYNVTLTVKDGAGNADTHDFNVLVNEGKRPDGDGNKEVPSDKGLSTGTIIFIVLLVIFAIAFFIFLLMRKKKEEETQKVMVEEAEAEKTETEEAEGSDEDAVTEVPLEPGEGEDEEVLEKEEMGLEGSEEDIVEDSGSDDVKSNKVKEMIDNEGLEEEARPLTGYSTVEPFGDSHPLEGILGLETDESIQGEPT